MATRFCLRDHDVDADVSITAPPRVAAEQMIYTFMFSADEDCAGQPLPNGANIKKGEVVTVKAIADGKVTIATTDGRTACATLLHLQPVK